MHGVAALAQLARQLAHGSEDRQDFLRMVQHIIGFLPHFHQDIDGGVIDFGEPAVPHIELVTEYQTQRGLR
ncbi:hypothetical protein D3C81_1983750 [compost metagenome]